MTLTSGKLTVTTDENGYSTTEARGVRYTIREERGEWMVHSDRLALGGRLCRNFGSVRYFATLADLETKVKSLRGIAFLISATS